MNLVKYLIGTVTLGVIVITGLYIKKLRKEQDVLAYVNSSLTKNLNLLSFYETNHELNTKLMGQEIPNIQCENNKQICELKALVNDAPVLVYRYTDISCNVCIESVLEQLNNKFQDSVSCILILCSYQFRRDFVTFKKINKLKFPIYRIENDALSLLPEEYNVPYCFILHPNMTIDHVYIPDKSFLDLNELYFDGIKSLLTREALDNSSI